MIPDRNEPAGDVGLGDEAGPSSEELYFLLQIFISLLI